MSRYYDKDDLKKSISLEQVFDLVEEWGGEPEYTRDGLIATTICHNPPGEGSRKLYYYQNTALFHCYSGCLDPSFDLFDLCIKVAEIQKDEDWELYDAMDYIAKYFGYSGQTREEDNPKIIDWDIFKRYDYNVQSKKGPIQLKEYDQTVLTRFSHPRILSWEQEGISYETCKKNLIGYYPRTEQIVIPHYDINNRLVGIRGRFLGEENAERYGKYRPLCANGIMYNHPLSMNLYNLNNSKDTIRKTKIAIIFESEKSTLAYQSYYGHENDISVAVCGSSISSYQIDLLKSLGVREAIIAFDKQFQEIGDDEFKRLKSKLMHFYSKYNNSIRITAVFDKHDLLPYKASPIDVSKEIFEKLVSERIIPQ